MNGVKEIKGTLVLIFIQLAPHSYMARHIHKTGAPESYAYIMYLYTYMTSMAALAIRYDYTLAKQKKLEDVSNSNKTMP